MKTKVKVGNITNLSDARYCAGMGVDLLGLQVGSRAPALDLKAYQDITGWVSGPALVLEWADRELPSDFASLVSSYHADFVQIEISQIEQLPDFETPLIVSADIIQWEKISDAVAQVKSRMKYLLLTSSNNTPMNVTLVNKIAKDYHVLLGHGVNENNLDSILSLKIDGIALSGSVEEKPGLKEYSEFSDILEKLEDVS